MSSLPGRMALPAWMALPGRAVEALAFVAVMAFAAWVMAAYHDRFWLAASDGTYAHIAERLLAGQGLNREIQDIHAGYVNFVNAAAMALFGKTFVALRYPLALLTLVQAGLIFLLLRPRGAALAAAGAAAMAALTFVQFLDPTANWYALFLLVTIIGALAWIPRESRWRLVVAGFLLTTLFLFRQLSGLLVAIGTLTYLLGEAPPPAAVARRLRDRLLASAVLAIMGGGLMVYLLTKTDATALILFGAGPLGIMVWAGLRGRCGNRQAATILLRLAAGGLVALAPLLLYHLAQGSLLSWIDDTVMVAFSLTELPFFELVRYYDFLFLAGLSMLAPSSLAVFVNSLFWVVLVLLTPVAGFVLLRRLWRQGAGADARPYLLPMLAVFHAVAAVHFQVPAYLTYTVALTLVGLLWLAAVETRSMRRGAIALTLFLSAVGLYYQAGQPMGRGWSGMVKGERVPLVAAPEIGRAGLRLDAAEVALYSRLIALIRRETPEDAAILALPVNPELYFLAARRNPTRFYNSAFGVRSDRDLEAVLEILRRDPPRLVFHQPQSVYNTPYSARLMEFVRSRYERLAPIEGFDIYRHRQELATQPAPPPAAPPGPTSATPPTRNEP